MTFEEWYAIEREKDGGWSSYGWASVAWEVAARQERERNSVEVARLREALELLKHDDGCFCEAAFAGPETFVRHTDECEAAQAALSTPADSAVKEGK